ncbi:MAG: UTP--glucose-1-phosphate uridylyltransferase [Planctomycetota bacterium]
MPTATLDDRLAAARVTLDAVGQAHVLDYFDVLCDDGRHQILSQIEGIDWPEVARLIETHVKRKPEFSLPENIEPAPWYPYEPTPELQDRYDRADALGEKLIRGGQVAAFTVAGGQGSRLGWDGPKGTFPGTPVRGLELFGCFAEYLLKVKGKYGAAVPWYVMTSPINNAATREFFEQKKYFGLDPAEVMLFPQAMMPAIDMATHRALLENPGSLALSPNGHGGSLKALWTSGAVADMKRRGVEQISYTQVDNPIVRMVDPRFLGLHALDDAQMSSKMLPKSFPKEKLGNFCVVDGKVTVIEYSNLPDELAEQKDDSGGLRFRAGSIALHAIRVDFVESLNTSAQGFSLPFNRAEKKVGCWDPASEETKVPGEPNAVKLETFVFDALPMCETSIVYETDRVDEFAPIKNADAPEDSGEVETDSPASSKQIQTERAARWLEAHAVSVPRDGEGLGSVNATIEIRQTTAIVPGDLAGVKLPAAIEPGGELLL